MNYEYLAMGRLLREGRLPRLKMEAAPTGTEVDELVETWINGNKSDVFAEIDRKRPIDAAVLAVRMFQQLDARGNGTPFVRGLEIKAG